MTFKEIIQNKVAGYYWKDDINCAATTLKVLSEVFETPLDEQVIHATIGLPGAGKCGALCGLVSGTLLFLGIWGRKNSIADSVIADYCTKFSNEFESSFKSLQCSILRPEGFHPENPPHLCETFTCKSIELSVCFIANLIAP